MFVALAASEELSRALVCRAWKLRQRHHWILAALPVVAFEYIPIVLKSDWSYLLGTLAGFGLKSAMSLIHIAAFVLIGYAMTRRRFGWIVAAIIYCSLSHALNNWFGARLAQMSAAEWLIFVTNIVLIVAVATIAWRTAGALTRAEAAAG